MFAAKSSRGLKPLFPLCLADSASQNNQKVCVIVVAERRQEMPVCSLCSGFTLMARSAAAFLSFFPLILIHLASYQSDKVCVVAPTGACEEVSIFPFSGVEL